MKRTKEQTMKADCGRLWPDSPERARKLKIARADKIARTTALLDYLESADRDEQEALDQLEHAQ
jgi:hypothetical protein